LVDIRWNFVRQPDPSREYVALVSFLPLRKFSAIPRFLQYAREIGDQVERSRGATGYSFRAKLLQRRSYTLSAWETEEDLRAFVRERPHSRVMIDVRPLLRETKFVPWREKGSSLPPAWDRAIQRLA